MQTEISSLPPDPADVPQADQPAEITKRSRSSFYYAFLFLPKDQRAALDAVYAYCRLVDDAVDEAGSPEEARARLLRWRERLTAIFDVARAISSDEEEGLLTSLRWAVRTFPLKREDFEAVIEGCEWDAERARYATWEELRAYCFRVASAVGLLCIEIFGNRAPGTRDYAIDLGLALQLTNIVRDVDEDAARGRIYLPLEDLAAFGVSEEDLLAGRRTPAVLRLLRFEAQRARLHYLRARAAIGPGERAHLVVAEIMGDIYYALLEKLEREGFPRERVRLSSARKALIAAKRFALARLGKA